MIFFVLFESDTVEGIRNVLGAWLRIVRMDRFRIRDGVVNLRVLGRNLVRLDRDADLDGFSVVLWNRGVRDGVLRVLGKVRGGRRKIGIFVLHGFDDDVEVFFVLILRLEGSWKLVGKLG